MHIASLGALGTRGSVSRCHQNVMDRAIIHNHFDEYGCAMRWMTMQEYWLSTLRGCCLWSRRGTLYSDWTPSLVSWLVYGSFSTSSSSSITTDQLNTLLHAAAWIVSSSWGALRSRVCWTAECWAESDATTSRNQFHVSISIRSWLDYKLMEYSQWQQLQKERRQENAFATLVWSGGEISQPSLVELQGSKVTEGNNSLNGQRGKITPKVPIIIKIIEYFNHKLPRARTEALPTDFKEE